MFSNIGIILMNEIVFHVSFRCLVYMRACEESRAHTRGGLIVNANNAMPPHNLKSFFSTHSKFIKNVYSLIKRLGSLKKSSIRETWHRARVISVWKKKFQWNKATKSFRVKYVHHTDNGYGTQNLFGFYQSNGRWIYGFGSCLCDFIPKADGRGGMSLKIPVDRRRNE